MKVDSGLIAYYQLDNGLAGTFLRMVGKCPKRCLILLFACSDLNLLGTVLVTEKKKHTCIKTFFLCIPGQNEVDQSVCRRSFFG